jgi:hypothetical protein
MKKRKKSNTPLKVIKTSLKSICLDTETILTINNYCTNCNTYLSIFKIIYFT